MTKVILLIEDNPTTRKMFRVALQTEGYRVLEAANGKEALQVAQSEHPDLIFQDWILPDVTGSELAAALRALPGGHERPLVALSGFPNLVEQMKAAPVSFDAALIKPVDLATLFDAVHRFLPSVTAAEATVGLQRHALVVDDDALQLKLSVLRLTQVGFRVTPAANAQAALRIARADRPDVILSDVLMPGLDGFEFCSVVRKDPELAHVPIVLTSMYLEDDRNRVLANECGANRFVIRNQHFRPVLEAVIEALDEPAIDQSELKGSPKDWSNERPLRRRTLEELASNDLVRREALQAAQLTILGGIADALARSADPSVVLSDVLVSCLDAGGITKAALYKTNRYGKLALLHSSGFSRVEERQLPTLFGHPEILEELESAPTALSELGDASMARAGLSALSITRCVGEGRVVGALLLGSELPHTTHADLKSFGRALATYVGQALLLADSFAYVHDMTVANRRLFASLELQPTLQTLVTIGTESLADLCEVSLLQDGYLKRNCSRHLEPDLHELVQRVLGSHAKTGGDSTPTLFREAVVGKACVFDLPDDKATATLEEPYASLFSLTQTRTCMSLPLIAQQRVLGTLLLCSSRRNAYNESDITRAEDLARRGAIAIENARLYEQARSANELKDDFLATISHELRTPLNAILGWSRMLKLGDLPESRRTHAVEVIERNAAAQAQLIEDLLDVSRMVTGKLTLDARLVDLVPIIEGAIDSVRPTIDVKQIAFSADLGSNQVLVLADARRIQQVLWNVLNNAVKFTPVGGRVEVTLRRSAESIEVTVADTGEGIAADFLPLVFERFKQYNGKISRMHQGLGIGLAICRDLVALHGGQICARSDGLNRGATIQVTLPAPQAERLQAPVRLAHDSPGLRDKTKTTWPKLDRLKVLIVDDDPDARTMMTTIVSLCSAVAFTAESAEEALEVIKQESPDVMLADIGLPGEDGYSLIRRLRALGEAEGGFIPAAALTAYVRPEDRRQALRAGFQYHVPKPVDIPELVEVVSSLARMVGVP
jgi:CheY-like chemotaxis protein